MVVGTPKRSPRVHFAGHGDDDSDDDFRVTTFTTPSRLKSVQESDELSSREASHDTIPPSPPSRPPKRTHSPGKHPSRTMVDYGDFADEQPALTLTVAPTQRRCGRCEFCVVLLAMFLIAVAVVVGVILGTSRHHPASRSSSNSGGGHSATAAAGTILHNATHGWLDLNATNHSQPRVTVHPPTLGSPNATDKTNTTTLGTIGQSLRNRFHHSDSPTAAPNKAPSFQ